MRIQADYGNSLFLNFPILQDCCGNSVMHIKHLVFKVILVKKMPGCLCKVPLYYHQGSRTPRLCVSAAHALARLRRRGMLCSLYYTERKGAQMTACPKAACDSDRSPDQTPCHPNSLSGIPEAKVNTLPPPRYTELGQRGSPASVFPQVSGLTS